MINLLSLFSQPVRCTIRSSLTVGLLTCIGILVSAPQATPDTSQWSLLGKPAYAQSSSQATNISNTEIRSYALSVLDIENIRQQWSDDIAAMLEVETLPSIACNDPDSIREIRRDVREMVIRFCDASIEIVEGHNLSISRFNTITELMNSNADLQQRIQDELLNLQSNSTRNSAENVR
jgi:Asp/Glu/hydantoin racemase